MAIQGLGYVGVRAKSVEDWTDFGRKLLGMQVTDRSAKSLALRMDDRKQRADRRTRTAAKVSASSAGRSPSDGAGRLPRGWNNMGLLSRAARGRSPTSAGSPT